MAAHQAPQSLGFSRQEHWSGLPFPPPMHESENEPAQWCPTLSHPMDCSLPGSSILGIFQEWGAIAGVGCHFLLQRIFLIQGSNLHLLRLLHWQANSLLLKTLLLGKMEGKRRRRRQRMRWLDSITDSVDMNLSKVKEMVKDREAWHAAIHGMAQNWTRLSN